MAMQLSTDVEEESHEWAIEDIRKRDEASSEFQRIKYRVTRVWEIGAERETPPYRKIVMLYVGGHHELALVTIDHVTLILRFNMMPEVTVSVSWANEEERAVIEVAGNFLPTRSISAIILGFEPFLPLIKLYNPCCFSLYFKFWAYCRS